MKIDYSITRSRFYSICDFFLESIAGYVTAVTAIVSGFSTCSCVKVVWKKGKCVTRELQLLLTSCQCIVLSNCSYQRVNKTGKCKKG